ncbi:Crp/Fnr family transcriptional regulator [Sphingosinicella sp. CPCC 101087]|uniref:Crp/Fnr family transcriptional regulator n=1 Tax=Sphingosinicella sp. CPCC 101087 TaxID=2497754 RepID=UPI00101C5E43|nr:Crp/Fnr family transcriptional regulator [Sphingosinicella sp. CPCC 101087]
MGGSCLAERLGHYVRLSASERVALDRLEEHDRSYRRGTIVISENDAPREMFIVRQGWLHSSVVLGNGSRQIMRFQFRGDMIGLPLLAFPDSPETVTAVTDVTLCPFGRERLAQLMAAHPRLSALVLALTVAERVSLADRLASIGRTSARARVSSLICEINARLRILGLSDGGAIQLPLTQEDIGDATGLTAVHVNRMMRGLVEDGLIERNGNHLRVIDEGRLCAEASFVDRTALETGWLPPAQ